MSAVDLNSYNTVPERMIEFFAKYPDGSLQPLNTAEPYRIETIGDRVYIVVVAAAYRTPTDPRPGVGMAYEQWPGKTNFTRESELQNAETSAWGRAIVAVGAADTKKGIASREDVQNRQAEQSWDPAGQEALVVGWMAEIEDAPDADVLTAVAKNIKAATRTSDPLFRLSPMSFEKLSKAGAARRAELDKEVSA